MLIDNDTVHSLGGSRATYRPPHSAGGLSAAAMTRWWSSWYCQLVHSNSQFESIRFILQPITAADTCTRRQYHHSLLSVSFILLSIYQSALP